MIKSSFLQIAFILLSSVAHAQVSGLALEWGEKFKSRKTVVYDILAADEDQFYAVKQKMSAFNRTVSLERYQSFQPTVNRELTSDREKGVRYQQSVFEMQHQLYIETVASGRKERSIHVQSVDMERLETVGENQAIIEQEIVRKLRYTQGEWFTINSRMEAYRCYLVEESGDDDSKMGLEIKLYNQFMELQWETKFHLPYVKELADIHSLTVSESGEVYVLLKVFKDKRKDRRKGERNYSYYVLSADQEGLREKQELKLQDNFIVDVELGVNDSGQLICGGFYSIDNYITSGVFFLNLDANTFEVLTTNILKFSLEFLSQGLSDFSTGRLEKKEEKGKDIGLNHVTFRDFVLREDGGVVLIGEYQDIYTRTYTDANGNQNSSTYYKYHDIYVVNISPRGEIEWAKKILKYQSTINDGAFYSSFFLAVKDDQLYFIFNDHPDNAGAKEGEKIRAYSKSKKRSTLMVVTMDNQGHQTREVLVSAKENDGMLLRPMSCEQVNDNELILFALNKKYNRFGKVTLE